MIEQPTMRTSTELTVVENNDHWSVMIAWPNGSINHFGKFPSEKTAIVWINDHRWMTTNVVTDLRLLRRGGRPKSGSSPFPSLVDD